MSKSTSQPTEPMNFWEQLRSVPSNCTKEIGGGRLRGMTDIKPQWRYQRMTEVFGPCGIGWKFEIREHWTEPGDNGQIAAFCNVMLFVKVNGEWSDGIPGTGGSMFIANEIKKGAYTSDEAHKMALTDALSVAMKMLGLASDIYMGDGARDTGSKYEPRPHQPQHQQPEIPAITTEQGAEMHDLLQKGYGGFGTENAVKLIEWATDGRTGNYLEMTEPEYQKAKAHITAR